MNTAEELNLEEPNQPGQAEPEEIVVSDDELLGAIDGELRAEEDDPNAVEDPDPDAPTTPEGAEGDGDGEPEKRDDDKDGAEKGDEPGKPEDKKEDPDKPEPDKEARPSDEFGELDESVPEKTRERFETLKSRFDDLVKERDTVKGEADKWVEAITGTGTNPQQFGMALTYLSKVNSGKREDLEDAYQIMEGELEALGKMLGKRTPAFDPLSEHPDLQQKVSEGVIDEDSALEIASSRAAQRLNGVQSQQQQEKQEHSTRITNAIGEVKALGEHLKKTDPEFAAKASLLETFIASAVESGAPPERWKGMIEKAYSGIKMPAAPRAPAPDPVPDPLRPTGVTPASGNMDKEPGSAFEAVDMALAGKI